jgi:hypothetical protein
VDPRTLSIFRKATAAFYFLFLLAIFPSWNRFFGWQHVSSGAVKDSLDIFLLFPFFPFETFWILGFLLLVWHWTGKHPRASSVALFIFHSSLLHRNPFASNGEDLVVRMLLFYSCFFPWKKEGRFFGSWAVRLAQINFIFIYLLSLPKKLAADTAWYTGDFMYYVLVNPTWSRITLPGIATYPGLSMTLTYVALLMEALVPFLIWFERTRLLALWIIVFFHSMIAITLNNVAFFSISMILGALLFLHQKDFLRFKKPHSLVDKT